MFLLYHSEGCNICGMVFHKCYVNDLRTTTCSGMLGHRNKFLCMVFQTIPSKFSCATFQNLQNISHFVTLFLAHEDVVIGFAIFHIEFSTHRLACFIYSSLILLESWLDHCNL
jgi:hypothetical protein